METHNGSIRRLEEMRLQAPPGVYKTPSDTFPSTNRSGANRTRPTELTEEPRQTRGYTSQDFVSLDLQREETRIPNETGDFPNYIERSDAELIMIYTIMHMATSLAPDLNKVIEETRRTPFTNRIASVRLHDMGKIKFPEYSGNTDPKTNVRAFHLEISRAHLKDDDKEAGYCCFFAENSHRVCASVVRRSQRELNQ